MFASVDAIYTLLHKRVKDTERFKKQLETIRKEIYRNGECNELQLSKRFDKVRALWMELAGCLDTAGLLLRERLKMDELVTEEGGM